MENVISFLAGIIFALAWLIVAGLRALEEDKHKMPPEMEDTL